MRLTILALVGVIALIGCGEGPPPKVEDEPVIAEIPDNLKDCTFQRVPLRWTSIVVVRCPFSVTSTTYKSGKSTYNNVTIDGAIPAADQLRAVDEAYEAKRKEILAGIDLQIAELAKRKAELETKK